MKNAFVGQKIKKAMRELDLTQKSLGQKIGVIQTQISNWINGYSNPSLKSLKKIAEATGKPLSYFTEESVSYSENINKNLGENQNIIRHSNSNNVIFNEQLEAYRTLLVSRVEKIENKLEVHTAKLDLIIEKLKNKKEEK